MGKGQWLDGNVEPGESQLKVVVWVLVAVAHQRKRLKQQQREGTVRLSVRRQGGGIQGETGFLGEKGTSLCNGKEGPWLVDSGFSSDGFSFLKMEKKVIL